MSRQKSAKSTGPSPQNFKAPRLFLGADLKTGVRLQADKNQANYLLNVLRLKAGERVHVFNGRDGEWHATLFDVRRSAVELEIGRQTRPQSFGPDIDYLFAPIKRARLDYMVQKAAEMGAARLRPVLTDHTDVKRVNLARMGANTIEAAEQCGILHVPEIFAVEKLAAVLQTWPMDRSLIFCDEAAPLAAPVEALCQIKSGLPKFGPLAVLIGPEGGFSPRERETLLSHPKVTALSLGPRILRADTAAVAVLALVNAVLGDWQGSGQGSGRGSGTD